MMPDIPPQHQFTQPGLEKTMDPHPIFDDGMPGHGRLKNKVAIITGGDSGIGKAIAISFAKEGAKVMIVYYDEHDDAMNTAAEMNKYGQEALLLATDIAEEKNCRMAIEKCMEYFNRIDILINNAAVQFPQVSITDITAEQLDLTFRINVFSQFYLIKHALPYMGEGSSIINTASVTAFKGNTTLLDYSATKGAIISFTRSLSQSLVKRGIRVNAVAPGPVWTPLIPASFDSEKVASFGKDTPIGRPAQPIEIAPCYVFLASNESGFITGQTLHPNGGTVVNG